MPVKKIASKFKLHPTRISQIVYKNRASIKIDKQYEDLKMMAHLKRLLNAHPNLMAKKSTLDIIEKIHGIVHQDENKKGDTSQRVTVVMNNVVLDGKPVEYEFGNPNRT